MATFGAWPSPLAQENEAFIERMISSGRFNNQSEVVRESLRRMEPEETGYLNPPVMSDQQARRIYEPHPVSGRRERALARKTKAALRG